MMVIDVAVTHEDIAKRKRLLRALLYISRLSLGASLLVLISLAGCMGFLLNYNDEEEQQLFLNLLVMMAFLIVVFAFLGLNRKPNSLMIAFVLLGMAMTLLAAIFIFVRVANFDSRKPSFNTIADMAFHVLPSMAFTCFIFGCFQFCKIRRQQLNDEIALIVANSPAQAA